MSVYVVQSGGAMIECHMEYVRGGEIVCTASGISPECLRKAVQKVSSPEFVKVDETAAKFYISTALFERGRTPGEVIKELAVLLRLC